MLVMQPAQAPDGEECVQPAYGARYRRHLLQRQGRAYFIVVEISV
jgi:hypothetical protein